jgi:hypothetical protein
VRRAAHELASRCHGSKPSVDFKVTLGGRIDVTSRS